MKRKMHVFSLCAVLVLFAFSLYMAWVIPARASLSAKITETQQSLKTSRGRENKQQAEYDKAMKELPAIREELKQKEPLAEEAEEKVTALKQKRKELRAEIKKLEEQQAEIGSESEGTVHE
jgi:peptidoglycan hydrolase CwlO-like protein